MIQKLSLDLKLARRRSGLSQADCAHLVGVDASRMSKLESGKAEPSVCELAILSLIFDRPADDFTKGVIVALRGALADRLDSMPSVPQNWRDWHQRSQTLQALSARLDGIDRKHAA